MLTKNETSVAALLGAWMVHLFTVSGAVFGLLSIQEAAAGNLRAALGYMCVCTAIDGVDGALARAFRVKHFLPWFDGSLLDNMVDYFTYVIVPAGFLMYAEILPMRLRLPVAAVMIITSGYQFCRADAKTPDHAFTGFPSYWNVAVCYLFLFDWPTAANLLVFAVCAVAVFIPVRYLYPSRTRLLRPLNIVLGMLWAAMIVWALHRFPSAHRALAYGSLFYVVYYLAVSLWITLKRKVTEENKRAIMG